MRTRTAPAWGAVAALALAVALLAGCSSSSGSDDAASNAGGDGPSTSTTAAPTTTLSKDATYAAIQEELVRACKEAVRTGQSPSPNFDPSWKVVTDPDKLMAAVKQCIATDQGSALGSAVPVPVQEVLDDPAGAADRVFTMIVVVGPRNTTTGPCVFTGHWDGTTHKLTADYAGGTALFTAGDAQESCPVLDTLQSGDTARMWVRSTGAAAGKPAFTILQTEPVSGG